MNKKELLAQIGQWKKNLEHQKIIDAVSALPENQRDYELTCILAREYNVIRRFAEAKALLESVRSAGKKDPNWFFHYGFSLMSLQQFTEAKEIFQQLLKMAPKNPVALSMLRSCDVNMEKQALAKAYGDGSDLDEEKTLEFVLKCHLHNSFEVPDQLEEDHIFIPAWNIRIYPEISDLQAGSVAVTFQVECPDWDRDIVEISAAKGKNPSMALGVACSSFLLALMNGVSMMAKKQNGLSVESEFAGKKHRWSVYRGNLLAGGDAQKNHNFNLYWDALKDELIKRLGNQKLSYVRVYASRSGEQVKAECRINEVLIPSLSNIVANLAKEWDCEGYGVHRQFFFFAQDEATYEPYPYDQEQLEELTQKTVRLYNSIHSQEDLAAFPGRLLALCNNDMVMARELQLYIPMVSAENAFPNLLYPETLTFDFGDHKETAYRSQLASFHSIQKALFWSLKHQVYGEETEKMYRTLVAASPLFHMIQQQTKAGNPVKDGMGVSLNITVDDHFRLR